MVRFKLDENADPRWAAPLAQAGHKVKSVAQQSIKAERAAWERDDGRQVLLESVATLLDAPQAVLLR